MSTDLTKTLDSQERSRWRTLRISVKSRMTGLWELVEELREIRDEKLYREDYKRFEDYLAEEAGLDRTYAHRLMEAADTKARLLPIGNKNQELIDAIQTEGQLRELKDVDDEKLGEVIEAAGVKAKEENRSITAKHLKEAKAEVISSVPPPEAPSAEDKSEVEAALENASYGNDIVAAIRKAKRLLKDCPEKPGTEGVLTRRRKVMEDLQVAVNEVRCQIPTSACPRCDGAKCSQCGNLGWVNAILYRELTQ